MASRRRLAGRGPEDLDQQVRLAREAGVGVELHVLDGVPAGSGVTGGVTLAEVELVQDGRLVGRVLLTRPRLLRLMGELTSALIRAEEEGR